MLSELSGVCMRCFGCFMFARLRCNCGSVVCASRIGAPGWGIVQMPSSDGNQGRSPVRSAMSNTKPSLRLDAGTYDAALSQKRVRGSGRSKSLGRKVSQKAEASSDNITMVYRALRVGESPTKLRKVLPDTKDYSILSLHMFPCVFLFGLF